MKNKELMEKTFENAKKLRDFKVGFTEFGKVKMYTSSNYMFENTENCFFSFKMDGIELTHTSEKSFTLEGVWGLKFNMLEFLTDVNVEISKQLEKESPKMFIKFDGHTYKLVDGE